MRGNISRNRFIPGLFGAFQSERGRGGVGMGTVISRTGGKESGPWVGVSLGLSLLCPLGTQQCAGGTSEKSDSRRVGEM